MKVLYIVHEDKINGASKSLLNIIDYFENKIDIVVISPYKTGQLVNEIIKRRIKLYYVPFKRWVVFKNNNYTTKKINYYLFEKKRTKHYAKKMAKILKNDNIDIIHSNTSVINLGYYLSIIMKKPHIWHVREFGEKDFNMYPLCSKYEYFKEFKNNLNTIICVSKTVAKKYTKKVSEKQIKIIYNGVEKPSCINTKKHSGKMICLQTGMINSAKGQQFTVKAISELYEEGINNIELWIAGSGDKSFLDIPKNCEKWLRFLGQVNDMDSIRKKVDVEIVASKSEAFGRTTIEAMMMKIPVIGSNKGGTSELIKDKYNGLLFESENYKDLKKKIKYLYNNRNEIIKLGNNAYNYSKEFFLIERCCKEIYKIYLEKIK